MKKILYLCLILLSFCFVPKVFALDDIYLYNEDVSSPNFVISNTLDNFVNRFFTVSSTTFTKVKDYNAWYCMFFYGSSYPNGVCATRPFVHSVGTKVIYSEEPFYAFYFYDSSGTPYLSKEGVSVEVTPNEVYSFTWNGGFSSTYNSNQVFTFHMSSDYKVNNISFYPLSYKKYISVFSKSDVFTGNLNGFTYLNDNQLNKVSNLMLIFENNTNATSNFNFENGFMYYNNTVFRFANDYDVRFGYPSNIQTTTRFPIIFQWNEDTSFPEYSSDTIFYTRLYFTNGNIGQTEGIYTFYKNVTDIAFTTYENTNGVWNGTSDYLNVNFTVNEAPVVPGEEEEEGTSNEDINNSINDINNNIMDDTPPDTSGLSDTAGWLPAGPVDSILNLPLTFLQRLNNSVNGTCSSLNLPLPYVNQTMELPCLNTVYSRVSGLNTFMTFFSTVISSLMLYYYFKNLYEWVGKKVSLNNDESWGGI